MLRKIIPIMAVVAILLTACGTPAEPTLSPEQVSGTAISMASTMIAETQAAIPTNTPIPPTETASPTALPTFTLEPLPAIEIASPTATSAPQGTCDGIMNVGEAGPQSSLRVENETGGPVTFSLWLGTPNAFGQCGFIPGLTVLAKNEKRVISIPKGNYYFYFFGEKAGQGSCYVNNRVGDNHLFAVKVRQDICVVP